MSNKELIERLHEAAIYGPIPCPVCNEAADALEAADKRIAELEAERDEWQRGEACATKAWGDAERKLAVAREALNSIAKNTCCGDCQEAKRVAQEYLAHIGGEDARS